MPTFKCRDIGMSCNFTAKAWRRGKLIKQISQHANSVHSMKEISPDLMSKIDAAIK